MQTNKRARCSKKRINVYQMVNFECTCTVATINANLCYSSPQQAQYARNFNLFLSMTCFLFLSSTLSFVFYIDNCVFFSTDGYSHHDVKLHWSDNEAVKKYKDITMAQFQLIDPIRYEEQQLGASHGE